LAAHVWSPHATTVIAATFVVMLLLAGSRAYTDVLAELARGMSASVGARMLLALALLAGAALGGWTAGRFQGRSRAVSSAAR
jgi:toxin CptA